MRSRLFQILIIVVIFTLGASWFVYTILSNQRYTYVRNCSVALTKMVKTLQVGEVSESRVWSRRDERQTVFLYMKVRYSSETQRSKLIQFFEKFEIDKINVPMGSSRCVVHVDQGPVIYLSDSDFIENEDSTIVIWSQSFSTIL